MKQGSTSAALPRVAQHETLQTINVVLQQAGLAAVRGALLRGRASTCRSGRYLQSLARKATLRLDPSIKRSVCRGCRAVMLPGVSAATRIRPSRSADLIVVVRCYACGSRHRLPCPARREKRFKVLARRRRKRGAAKDALQSMRKVANIDKSCVVSERKPVVVVAAPDVGPARTSQRSRRRAGREKALQARDLKSTMAVSTKKARSRKRGRSSSIARDNRRQNAHVSAAPSQRPRLSKATSPQQHKKSKALRLDLARYSDRNAGQGALSWKHDMPEGLDEKQREALTVFRGDHVLSVGLGKGGTVVRDGA